MVAKRHSFSARITKRPKGWVQIEIPAHVSRALAIKGAIPVVGVVNGRTKFKSSFLPRGEGRHFLPMKTETREDAGVDVGDTVKITFEIDSAPRAVLTPEDVYEALEAEGLLDGYALIPPGRKAQFLNYLEEAVHEETRAKRVARLVELAHEAREKQADREILKAARAAKRAAASASKKS